MASFQSKIHCRKPRKGNNETYCSDPFLPTRLIIENSKKIVKKLKNASMASFKARIGWKRPRKKENKYCLSFLSYPMRNRKFQKN